jgi:hypothetical protein
LNWKVSTVVPVENVRDVVPDAPNDAVPDGPMGAAVGVQFVGVL